MKKLLILSTFALCTSVAQAATNLYCPKEVVCIDNLHCVASETKLNQKQLIVEGEIPANSHIHFVGAFAQGAQFAYPNCRYMVNDQAGIAITYEPSVVPAKGAAEWKLVGSGEQLGCGNPDGLEPVDPEKCGFVLKNN